ncbi:isoprenylcysteine carboxylmethyltransferase family protein [Rhodanobacter sp. L36]|uniref:methyltransferase family protein n=1 Tax=Rhodanobacter sp. L36 TaxID=1747221 RepID=UPI00131D3F8F|nr:isoprenylcysteine carboxylmethyltransferase family protein [Rhodanobacter sp. L36]
MALPIDTLIKSFWIFFALFWIVSAFKVKQAVRTEPMWLRFLKHWLPVLIGGVLLGGPGEMYAGTALGWRLYPSIEAVAVLGMLMTLAGVLFACWARVVLGTNWSGVVQVKRDHELIERGPYGYVRHPIYTGLLMAFLGTAMAIGELRGFLAVAIVAVSFWRKLRLEERWMGEQFGDAYADYMRRVKALVPGVL